MQITALGPMMGTKAPENGHQKILVKDLGQEWEVWNEPRHVITKVEVSQLIVTLKSTGGSTPFRMRERRLHSTGRI